MGSACGRLAWVVILLVQVEVVDVLKEFSLELVREVLVELLAVLIVDVLVLLESCRQCRGWWWWWCRVACSNHRWRAAFHKAFGIGRPDEGGAFFTGTVVADDGRFAGSCCRSSA